MKKNEKEEEGAKIKVSLVLPLRYSKNCLLVVVLLKSHCHIRSEVLWVQVRLSISQNKSGETVSHLVGEAKNIFHFNTHSLAQSFKTLG